MLFWKLYCVFVWGVGAVMTGMTGDGLTVGEKRSSRDMFGICQRQITSRDKYLRYCKQRVQNLVFKDVSLHLIIKECISK